MSGFAKQKLVRVFVVASRRLSPLAESNREATNGDAMACSEGFDRAPRAPRAPLGWEDNLHAS